MLLAASELLERVRSNSLLIEPFEEGLLKPASYVLRLGRAARRYSKLEDGPLDVWRPQATARALESPVEFAELELGPGELVLAETLERVRIPPDCLGLLSGLSHVARFGLSVTGDSHFVSPGFGSSEPTAITLELASTNPNVLRIPATTPVCHLALVRIDGDPAAAPRLARSIYDGKRAPHEPLLYEEFAEILGGLDD